LFVGFVGLSGKRESRLMEGLQEHVFAMATNNTTALLEISTLGGVSIKLGEVELDSILPKKAQALLIYLAYIGKPLTRKQLADLFWYERSEEQGLSNLRTLLTRMRLQLSPYLIINRETVAFDVTQPYHLDVVELRQCIAATARSYNNSSTQPNASALPHQVVMTNLELGLALYKGEFLADFNLADAAGFEEWADAERQSLHNNVLEALDQLILYREGLGNTSLSHKWVGRLLQLDPLREEAHRQRMLLLTLDGQPNAALAHYKSYQRYLAHELDIAPEAETTDLYERIKQGKVVTASLKRPLSSKVKKTKTSDNNQAGPNLDKVSQLKRVSLFVDTPGLVLERLALSLEEVRLEAGEVIFQKGELGESMYIIIEGQVRVHDDKRTLNQLGERDIFGEMALLDAAPRLATVTTLTPTRLWKLEQRDLYRLMVGQIEVVRGIIGVLSARLRERVEDLVDLQKRYEALIIKD
jgi:DNA-binding SARP family transcriptional activator